MSEIYRKYRHGEVLVYVMLDEHPSVLVGLERELQGLSQDEIITRAVMRWERKDREERVAKELQQRHPHREVSIIDLPHPAVQTNLVGRYAVVLSRQKGKLHIIDKEKIE